MPTVKKGEKKKNYISRCIPIVMGEGKPQKEAIGKCYGLYDYFKKKKKKKGKKNESFVFPKFSDLYDLQK